MRSLTADVAASALFVHVADLDDYPAWMPLVHEVERLHDGPDDGDPAWSVELRAQVGPFARSKRLRMERTELVDDVRAVFERRELDGREHSRWVLRADLRNEEAAGDNRRTTLTMTMAYFGSLWTGPILERVLDDQVRRGSERLLELVREPQR